MPLDLLRIGRLRPIDGVDGNIGVDAAELNGVGPFVIHIDLHQNLDFASLVELHPFVGDGVIDLHISVQIAELTVVRVIGAELRVGVVVWVQAVLALLTGVGMRDTDEEICQQQAC